MYHRVRGRLLAKVELVDELKAELAKKEEELEEVKAELKESAMHFRTQITKKDSQIEKLTVKLVSSLP